MRHGPLTTTAALALFLLIAPPSPARQLANSRQPSSTQERTDAHQPAGDGHAQASAPAATPESLDLAELACTSRASANAPALALAIATPDGQISVASDGVRLMGQEARITDDDLWHLGSITKSMTGTLAARLVERGLIAWEDTIAQRLGEAIPDMQEQYRGVTLAQLLAHRSGMPGNIPGEHFRDFRDEPDDPIADRLAWCRIALAMDPVGPPGETFQYSNNGYIIAGAMLEAAAGESWESLMRAEVFEPLGLASAGFGPPAGDTPTSQPRGHRPSAEGDRPVPPTADNPPALGPAGRIHMSLADLVRYAHAHAVRDPEFLSDASYEFLHTPSLGGNYAGGWVAITPTGRWHNGSNTMWYAEVTFDTQTHAAAAVAVNDGDVASVQPAVREALGRLMQSMK